VADSRIFILVDEARRLRASDYILGAAPEGWCVKVYPPAKTREQEERFHAMVGDVAAQWQHAGRKWDKESMKRIIVDQFRRDTAKDPAFIKLWESVGQMEIAPSIDGSGIVAIGWQTRRFPKALYSALIEWTFAFGAEVGIKWTDDRSTA
jgi:NinB protein